MTNMTRPLWPGVCLWFLDSRSGWGLFSVHVDDRKKISFVLFDLLKELQCPVIKPAWTPLKRQLFLYNVINATNSWKRIRERRPRVRPWTDSSGKNKRITLGFKQLVLLQFSKGSAVSSALTTTYVKKTKQKKKRKKMISFSILWLLVSVAKAKTIPRHLKLIKIKNDAGIGCSFNVPILVRI